MSTGAWFPIRAYVPEPLIDFHQMQLRLPAPVWDEEPDAVRMYWRAWRMAERGFRWPYPGSPLVANYINHAFDNSTLTLWDASFITMFMAYGHLHVPGIRTLDNFYCRQLASGEIPRQIELMSGEPNTHSHPGTPSSLNHPILAWAELRTFRISADRSRLGMDFVPLLHYYSSYELIRDPESGLYRSDWASMDNSPRNQGLRCGVDTASQMVLFARDLAAIASEIGRTQEAEVLRHEAEQLSARINQLLWDEEDGFYYDLGVDGRRLRSRTIAAFWTLIAGVASQQQASRLVAQLQDPDRFWRTHAVPTVAADDPGYFADGHYWCGGVWAPTNTMVIAGLERAGFPEIARQVALNHHANVLQVFRDTGTLWEMYAADSAAPGRTGNEPAHNCMPDFVGWSGMAPIAYLIEHLIGLKIDGPGRRVRWDLRSESRTGCERLYLAGFTLDLLAEATAGDGSRKVRVRSNGDCHLDIAWRGRTTQLRLFNGEWNITLPAA